MFVMIAKNEQEEVGSETLLSDSDKAFHELLLAQDLNPLRKFEFEVLPLRNER
jgi:hypothetical protein